MIKRIEFNEYVDKFNDQIAAINNQLHATEKMAHCIDTFNHGTCYYPQLVITNHGRVWNLNTKKWVRVFAKDTKHNNTSYYCTGAINHFQAVNPLGSTTKPVHELVAAYFCDRKPIIDFATRHNIPVEDAVIAFTVHHKESFSSALTNEQNNASGNLQFILYPRYVRSRIKKYGLVNPESAEVLLNAPDVHTQTHNALRDASKSEAFDNDPFTILLLQNIKSDKVAGIARTNPDSDTSPYIIRLKCSGTRAGGAE